MNDYRPRPRVNGRPQRAFPLAYLRGLIHPEWIPAGAHDVREILAGKPAPALGGKTPVLLVHGTWMSSFSTFPMLAPMLAKDRPVFTLDYGSDPSALVSRLRGVRGTGDLAESFAEVTDALDRFIAHLGVEKIDLIGHSQGGLHCRSYANVKIDALYDEAVAQGASEEEAEQVAAAASPVRAVISLAGNHRGTSGGPALRILKVIERTGLPVRRILDRILGCAAVQQSLSSPYITKLNGMPRGFTRRGPVYLNIGTPFDTIVTPWRGSLLPETPGHSVTNVNNADSRGDWSDHLALLYSPNTLARVRDFLAELDERLGTEPDDKAHAVRAARPVRVIPAYGALPQIRFRRRR